VYGSRKVHHDLLGLGEDCAEDTVARLMQAEGFRAQVGYKRRPGKHGSKPSIVAANQLDQDFDVAPPIRYGSPTSPTSAPMKAGSIWLS
jgi:putative transposase